MARVGALILAALALANWWSRWRGNQRVERWTKPAVTLGMMIAALVVPASSTGARACVVAGLVACLFGDVALLPISDRFLIGLGAFAVGHVLFGIGAVMIGVRPLSMGLAMAVGVPAVALLGWRIASASARLRPAVTIYITLILVMGVLVAGTASPVAVVGAVAFAVSDTILGWNRFVRPLRWAPTAIMATYHLALACLVGMLAT